MTAQLLRTGRMINQQMSDEVRRMTRDDRPIKGIDPRFPAVCWPVEEALIFPPLDKAHPLDESFAKFEKMASLYANLCRAVPRKVPDPLAALDRLTGLAEVKAEIRAVFAEQKRAAALQEMGRPVPGPSRQHMIFAGNPGTGKTTVAKIVGKLFADYGILSGNKFNEVTARDLVAEHVGGTETKCETAFEQAAGGVLFIDEAYKLTPRGKVDYSHIVINIMVDWMNKRAGDLAFILAGYPGKIRSFVNANPGFDRRFRWIEFVDYTDDELMIITRMMLGDAQEHLVRRPEEAIRAPARRAPARLPYGQAVIWQRRRGGEPPGRDTARPALRLDALGRPPTDDEWAKLLAEDVWAAAYPAVSPRSAADHEPAEEEP